MGIFLDIHQFPCLNDNYGFLVHEPDSGETAAIDTPDAERYLAEAKLRVEAIELLPRLIRFTKEKDVNAPGVDALVRLLQGAKPEMVLARLFAG